MKQGIDVSYSQGSINWARVKASKKVDFAIIRSSFGSDLPSQTDAYFHHNAAQCIKNNIPFGIYHFAYFINRQKAIDEANFAIRLANEYKNNVKFIALDVEEDSERYAQRVGASPDWTDCAIAFLETVRSAGYTPVIYTNQSWILYKYDWDRLAKYELWYAAPGASAPKYKCSLWQYSWTGHIDGIIGDVDVNYLYNDALLETKQVTGKQKNTKKKTIKQLAQEVIQGKWGAGEERKKKLTDAGYDYAKVQGQVNILMREQNKTIDQLAAEVIAGKWGNGEERKKKLTEAGYNYSAVQDKVNELMQARKTNEQIACEVIRGKWGAGQTRVRKLTEAGYNYLAVQAIVNELMGGG